MEKKCPLCNRILPERQGDHLYGETSYCGACRAEQARAGEEKEALLAEQQTEDE